MNKTARGKFIVIEGCDNSGKSTLAEYLGKVIPNCVNYKEPNFSSEQSDALNFLCENAFDREAIFLEDHLLAQEKYEEALASGQNVILDRYLWTGLAYLSAFTPDVLPAYEAIYLKTKNLFLVPDAYMFIKTPSEALYARRDNDKINMGVINSIVDGYFKYEDKVPCGKKIIVENDRSLEELLVDGYASLLVEFKDTFSIGG